MPSRSLRQLEMCSMRGCASIEEPLINKIAAHCSWLRCLQVERTGAAAAWAGKRSAEEASNKPRRVWQGRGKEPVSAPSIHLLGW